MKNILNAPFVTEMRNTCANMYRLGWDERNGGNISYMLDEKKFTHTLWEMCTECIVVFPDGVGVLPWMLCGTNEIGEATAEKMKEFRLVVWGMHGIYGAGKTMDETFGLIETVEKAAQIYMLTAHLPRVNTIKDEEMVTLAEFFKVKYRKDFLNL